MKKETKHFLERNYSSVRRDLSFDNLFSVASNFFEDVDSPVSLGLFLRLKYASFEEYLNFEINPDDYLNPDEFHLDYQCCKLFSKATFLPNVFDTKQKAIESFIEAEAKCLETNNRFSLREDPLFRDPEVCAVIHGASRKISRILGDCPTLDKLNFRFGPGQVVGLSKTTAVADKLTSDLTLTRNLFEHFDSILDLFPGWTKYRTDIVRTSLYDSHFVGSIVDGSKLGFVPKNAKTDRAICTEPLLNSFVQLGIGRYLRSRLRKAGCNLNSQERNQELARVGSITNDLATIDLSSASDTISYMTVLELLPLPWFDLLDLCRSPNFTYEGNCYEFNKFSSMGNGYTFELESLIFLALSRSVCEYLHIDTDNVSVYGDDIIIPHKAEPLLRKILDFLGFKVNESKSFTNGPFRESCGKDWFLGQLVRPFFFKSALTNQSLIGWCNSIWRASEGLLDSRYHRFYTALKKLVPEAYYCLQGPDGYGDGHFTESYELGKTNLSSYRKRGWDGFGYYTLSSSPIARTRRDYSVGAVANYLSQFIAEPSYNRLDSCLFRGLKLRPLPSLTLSDNSNTRKGVYLVTQRRSVRYVVRQAFHPWN